MQHCVITRRPLRRAFNGCPVYWRGLNSLSFTVPWRTVSSCFAKSSFCVMDALHISESTDHLLLSGADIRTAVNVLKTWYGCLKPNDMQ